MVRLDQLFQQFLRERTYISNVTTSTRGWPITAALGTLAAVTILMAFVSEVFVESVQDAAVGFGMTPAFVDSSSPRSSAQRPR